MPIRLEKPWSPLTEEIVRLLPAQLGVYQLASSDGEIIYIGYAGARSLFGLRGELLARLGQATSFRVEVTASYLTRYRELLMLHHADNSCYPADNTGDEVRGLGHLSPAGGN